MYYLPDDLFLPGFPVKILHACLISRIRATCHVHLTLLDFLDHSTSVAVHTELLLFRLSPRSTIISAFARVVYISTALLQ